MEKYPLTKCLHPVSIVNKYTGESLIVPCGHCELCNMQKSSMSTLKCKLESASHRFTYFVTLTYANEHLPLAAAIKNGDNYYLVNVTERDAVGEILTPIYSDNKFMQDLAVKCNCDGLYPFLLPRDVQLFMKRLRKRITNEKIRYFVCGEYGPVHFRPHYHLLLWFDESETLQNIGQNIRESWPYGFVDASLSEGQCASYVASYVNGSCNLPSIFKKGRCKPFTCHSRFLGEEYVKSFGEEVPWNASERFDERSVLLDGTYTDVSLWRSLKAWYFPRCKDYARKSELERYSSYRAYAKIREWTQEVSPYKQAKIVLDYILEHFNDIAYMDECSMYTTMHYLQYFLLSNGIKSSFIEAEYMKYWRSIYMELRISAHFINYVCSGHSDYNYCIDKIRKIDEYYQALDYKNLRRQCEQQKEFVNESLSLSDYVLFYNNASQKLDLNYKELLKANIVYKRYHSKMLKRSQDSVKHKELNDRNKFFNNR